MSNEQNKPIEAQELADKELDGVVGGKLRDPAMLQILVDKLQMNP